MKELFKQLSFVFIHRDQNARVDLLSHLAIIKTLGHYLLLSRSKLFREIQHVMSSSAHPYIESGSHRHY